MNCSGTVGARVLAVATERMHSMGSLLLDRSFGCGPLDVELVDAGHRFFLARLAHLLMNFLHDKEWVGKTSGSLSLYQNLHKHVQR